MRTLTNRSKVLVGCALAVAVVAGVAIAVWPREPLYDGHPLSYWLDRLPPTLNDGKLFHDSFSIADTTNKLAFSATEVMAQNAVIESGPHCLQMLVERLQAKDTGITRIKQRITIWWTLQRLKPNLGRMPQRLLTPETRRRQAVTALVQLGDTARPVLPEVLALAKSDPDPGVRASGLEVLRHLSPADHAQVVGQTNVVTAAAH